YRRVVIPYYSEIINSSARKCRLNCNTTIQCSMIRQIYTAAFGEANSGTGVTNNGTVVDDHLVSASGQRYAPITAVDGSTGKVGDARVIAGEINSIGRVAGDKTVISQDAARKSAGHAISGIGQRGFNEYTGIDRKRLLGKREIQAIPGNTDFI